MVLLKLQEKIEMNETERKWNFGGCQWVFGALPFPNNFYFKYFPLQLAFRFLLFCQSLGTHNSKISTSSCL